MKTTKILIIIIALAGIFATACDELLGDLLKFNSEWFSVEFTIEPSDEVGDLVFSTEEFEANLDSVLDANGVDRENIASAKLSDAKISILTDGCNFDPVESVELLIETPGLGSTRIAWLDSIPDGVTMIELELNMDDLQAYLLETQFKVTAAGTLSEKVDKTVELVADIRWIIRGDLTP
ncbi:MAG TPA: hypothetical protein ENI20_07520 [Bacteroides sp.]|nr:hypothetical protein [Bacteroides sp.]